MMRTAVRRGVVAAMVVPLALAGARRLNGRMGPSRASRPAGMLQRAVQAVQRAIGQQRRPQRRWR
jgi:hypothetical protein